MARGRRRNQPRGNGANAMRWRRDGGNASTQTVRAVPPGASRAFHPSSTGLGGHRASARDGQPDRVKRRWRSCRPRRDGSSAPVEPSARARRRCRRCRRPNHLPPTSLGPADRRSRTRTAPVLCGGLRRRPPRVSNGPSHGLTRRSPSRRRRVLHPRGRPPSTDQPRASTDPLSLLRGARGAAPHRGTRTQRATEDVRTARVLERRVTISGPRRHGPPERSGRGSRPVNRRARRSGSCPCWSRDRRRVVRRCRATRARSRDASHR
jgi:hypothetical protein